MSRWYYFTRQLLCRRRDPLPTAVASDRKGVATRDVLVLIGRASAISIARYHGAQEQMENKLKMLARKIQQYQFTAAVDEVVVV